MVAVCKRQGYKLLCFFFTFDLLSISNQDKTNTLAFMYMNKDPYAVSHIQTDQGQIRANKIIAFIKCKVIVKVIQVSTRVDCAQGRMYGKVKVTDENKEFLRMLSARMYSNI